MNKVGIAIINYNSGKFLRVTLESLLKAECDTAYDVAVIDNGSEPSECKAAETFAAELRERHPDVKLDFVNAGKNLGFSGGNNVLIQRFLEDGDITHICLLNSDVYVTDHWLDYLVEKDRDVIGPVTNAAGNEQTIQIDYTASVDALTEQEIQTFAQRRHLAYRDYVTETDLVTFFATVIKREVIEKIGLLDEQFYPGSYEDDDYCVRICNAGYRIWIARDVFLHHFGSGSFAKLDMDNRKNIGNINRERFEKKWKKPWKDRTWKLLESCRQDMDYLLKADHMDWQRLQLNSSVKDLEKLLQDWGEAILFFTTQADKTDAPPVEYSARQLINMLKAKAKRRIRSILGRWKQKVSGIIHARENRRQELTGMERVYSVVDAARREGHKPVCVFAPMYNKENERDGYVQRIKAIDTTVLAEFCRVYLYDEGTECPGMRFDFIDPLHAYIVFNSHDEGQRDAICKLVRACGTMYTHSLLRFMEDRTSTELWRIFDYDEVRIFWDVHGTVPEEYALSGSELGSRLANHIESVLAEKADVAVVVTEAMGKYLRSKYPSMKAEIVVVPILNMELLKPVETTKNRLEDGISVVYAGGTQPWQNIGLMQDIMASAHNLYHYRMFVPNPQEFRQLWGDRTQDIDMRIESKSPEELYREYETCDFGFVLRDNSPVNYVACPTKIIEYLKFGIIPVLKSTEIGDFVSLGMQYITEKDLRGGITVSETTREEMIRNNYAVLDKLEQMYRNGLDQLKRRLGE